MWILVVLTMVDDRERSGITIYVYFKVFGKFFQKVQHGEKCLTCTIRCPEHECRNKGFSTLAITELLVARNDPPR